MGNAGFAGNRRIGINKRGIAVQATRELLMGQRRIASFSLGDDGTKRARERMRDYRETLEATGHAFVPTWRSSWIIPPTNRRISDHRLPDGSPEHIGPEGSPTAFTLPDASFAGGMGGR